MPEFRYQATSLTGNPVQGVLTAPNAREAQRNAEEVCRQRRMRLTALQKRSTFIYKARRGNEKVFRGEQKAFSKEEVENALRKLNYQILSVQKKLFDIKLKPPTKDIVLFARISADLLRERLPYDEILQLLANDTENKTLADTIREIHQDLKDGKDGRAVFGKHADVLGKFTTYMLSVASTSGNMAEVYESTAKFLERDEEFKKSLKSAMIMPAVIVLALLGAVAYYVGYIFPATASMFVKFGVELPPMTKATLQLSDFLRGNALWLFPACIAPIVVLVLFFVRTVKGRLLMDRFIIRIPVIGSLLHKTSIEIFARVFYALYSGSGENINVIRIAAEACRNSYMERQIKEVTIPMMVKEGKGFVESLEKADVFTQNAISRLRSGAESGALRSTALQLANYYERETTYKLKNVVELINILISLLIMVVMTALTLVSSETAVISPKSPTMR
ncbi:MAG: type II secretion system F family protein [Candidatus Latescibacteria bacterium]|nr:type II secretion system F family protein [Candidatus Latescibacterota bacterium]